jgi:hypothetical protein
VGRRSFMPRVQRSEGSLLPLNRDPHRLKIGYSIGRYGPEIGRRVLPGKK